MKHANEYIVTSLKTARRDKGLSQRDLGAKADLPQSHISKIETGAVDLKLSSLVELARVLGLEVTLVPRKLMPAVEGIVRNSVTTPRHSESRRYREHDRLRREQHRVTGSIQEAIEGLSNIYGATSELRNLQESVAEIANLRLGSQGLQGLGRISKALREIQEGPEALRAIQNAASAVQQLRNLLAHMPKNDIRTQLPAYRLDEDDDYA